MTKRGPYRVHFQTNHLWPELGLLRMLEPVQIGRMPELKVAAEKDERKSMVKTNLNFVPISDINAPGVGAPKNRPVAGAVTNASVEQIRGRHDIWGVLRLFLPYQDYCQTNPQLSQELLRRLGQEQVGQMQELML